MSQHDMDIANQASNSARSDINNALKALASCSSGNSAPSTTYANQLWYEPDTNTLWMRNEANSGWLRIGYINQSDGMRFIENEVVNTSGSTTAFLGTHSQSTWDTGTNTQARLISPDRLKNSIPSHLNASGSAPIYACRAWVTFNAVGTLSIRGSQNVSSVTDNGTGDYTINFSTNMPNSNYAVVGTASQDTADKQLRAIGPYEDVLPTTSSVRILCRDRIFNDTGNPKDTNYVSVAIFG